MQVDKINSIIYCLVDPISGDIRYVGKTTGTLLRRWQGHISHAKDMRNTTHRDYWIRSLSSKGEIPAIEEIESGMWDTDTCNAKEIYWISRFKELNYDLTNKTAGGDGGNIYPVSSETRTKIRESSKRNWESHEYRAALAECTEEYWKDNQRARDAVSRQTTERWADPNYTVRETFKTAEYRQKRSSIMKEISSTEEGKARLASNGKKSSLLRRQCLECGLVSKPSAIGAHQNGKSKHVGFLDLPSILPASIVESSDV